ncbi:hypothetical protein HK104_011136 [Borealophlyctis nickersoniae]|nr:hypothetical protein HK104_011136 [Borealophlyctis nickersoniae]
MSLPDDVLRKVYVDLQNKVTEKSHQLNLVRQQLAARELERKRSQLTATELESFGEGVTAYRTVGKMFMQEPLSLMTKELRNRVDAAEKESSIMQRAAAKLERELNDAVTTLKDITHAQNKE